MPNAKDDDSTDIESLVPKFAKDMSSECASLRKARIDKQKKVAGKKDDKKEPPTVTFVMSTNSVSKGRTPAVQAEQVVAGKSWVCWSAHMADTARHVIMKADGKVTWDAKKTMGEDWDAFKKTWSDVMKRHGLKNFKGADGWGDGDEFHLEIAESKVSRTDERAKACLDEYAKMTRQDGKTKNDKFEKDYAKLLKEYIAKYETASKK